jgi:hypothetical protein
MTVENEFSPGLTDDDKGEVVLTVEEMVTVQAALKVANEAGAISPERADSVGRKLDEAIDRWAVE